MRKPLSEFPTRSDTNRAGQLQKMVRGLKFRIKEEEGLYYPCHSSKSKIAYQLRSYGADDLRFCLSIYKMQFFS